MFHYGTNGGPYLLNFFKYAVCLWYLKGLVLVLLQTMRRIPSILAFLTTLMFILPGYGQHRCTGRVLDEKGQPVAYANIILYDGTDSLKFVGTTTDTLGVFEFRNIPYASYYLRSALLGYEDGHSVLRPAVQHDTVQIIMPVNATTLSEFTVETKVNRMQVEPGKTTLNIENSTLAVGQNSFDLLRKVPGVFVDNEGNISIRGKQDVNVMIDGKPTYLSGDQLKNFLKSLNAANISKIEVITQPGANYDAEGNAGIINIVLKKKVTLGFNGTVDGFYGQGFYPKAGGSFSFNYGKGKWNIYGSYSYNHDVNFIWITVDRLINSSSYYQDYWGKSIDNSHATKFNFDYDINSKWSVGTGVNLILSHSEWQGFTRTSFGDTATGVVDSLQTQRDRTPYNNYNLQLNFNTQWKIDTLGQKLSMNVDGGGYLERNRGNYHYGFYNQSGDMFRVAPDINFTYRPNLYLVAGKVDYVHPHFFKFKLEAGFKSSFVTNESDVSYRTLDSLGQTVIIPGQTNQYLYRENINALYLSLTRELKRWTFTAGLRGELTNISGHQLTINQVNRQDYFSLFPTAGITWRPHDNHVFNLMYSRRIDRPEYSELNPFIYTLDAYSSYQGNPYLKPQFSNNFEFTYTLFDALTLSAAYSLVDNSIIDGYNIDSLNPKRLIFTKRNIGLAHNFTAGVNFMMPLTKWWMVMLNGSAIYTNFRDSALSVNQVGWVGQFSAYMEFTLPKKFAIELNGWAMTGQLTGQQEVSPMGEVSIGISKRLLKDHLVLKLNASDLFRTSRFVSENVLQDGGRFASTFWWDSRVVMFSLSWNFGVGKNYQPREGSDSFNRVGGGR